MNLNNSLNNKVNIFLPPLSSDSLINCKLNHFRETINPTQAFDPGLLLELILFHTWTRITNNFLSFAILALCQIQYCFVLKWTSRVICWADWCLKNSLFQLSKKHSFQVPYYCETKSICHFFSTKEVQLIWPYLPLLISNYQD